MKLKKLLINGGCGFLGSNLAQHALKSGIELVVLDNLSRLGAADNLKWLQEQGEFNFINGDVRNANDVENVIRSEKPDAVFNVAGQVAMTTSIANPRKDFEINALGTFNVLDSIRKYSPDTCMLFSSIWSSTITRRQRHAMFAMNSPMATMKACRWNSIPLMAAPKERLTSICRILLGFSA